MPSNALGEDLSTKFSQRAVAMSQPTSIVPSVAAPPAEVRLFVSHLLQEHGISQNDAQNVASQWKIGRGREMRSYDPSIYFEVFGAEYGWILYREIKLRIHEEKCQKLTYKYRTGECALNQNTVLSLCEQS
jgi:hypothetical protein